jgi:hypothetical protein
MGCERNQISASLKVRGRPAVQAVSRAWCQCQCSAGQSVQCSAVQCSAVLGIAVVTSAWCQAAEQCRADCAQCAV